MSIPDLNTVFLSLGTNIGDRRSNLRTARFSINAQVQIESCSHIYETPPWGYIHQTPFYNQVIKGTTQLSPVDLMKFLKQVESDLGRIPTFQNGPRIIDIDILFYNDLVLEKESLVIPHPRMHDRVFVWLPLADIAPNLIHPVLKRSVSDVLGDLETADIIYIASDCYDDDVLTNK